MLTELHNLFLYTLIKLGLVMLTELYIWFSVYIDWAGFCYVR